MQRKWQNSNYTNTVRAVLYIRDPFKMHSYLHIDIISYNPRNVPSTAPYMADSACVEGENKQNRKPTLTK